jgi:hypothetical protein
VAGGHVLANFGQRESRKWREHGWMVTSVRARGIFRDRSKIKISTTFLYRQPLSILHLYQSSSINENSLLAEFRLGHMSFTTLGIQYLVEDHMP